MRRSLLVLSFWVTPALLQAQLPGDTAHVPDLVVTATRVPVAESALPAATTVLEGADLRARGVRFVLDALREVPGITVVQSGSYGGVTSVFMRGGESDYVKVLLDGVPLNLPGGSVDFANLTTVDLDRIEIVRGPASVLYGADAMSGVIQLFTRRATSTGRVDIAGEGGTFGTSTFSGHVDDSRGPWSVSATADRQASNGIYAFNNDYRNTAGSARLAYDAGSRGQVAFTVRNGDGVSHFPTDGDGNVVDSNQFTEERTLATALDASRSLGRTTGLHLEVYASREHDGYTNRPDSPGDSSGFDFNEDRSALSWRRGADLRFDWRADPRALVSVGAGLERETDTESDIGTSNFGFGAEIDTTALAANRTTHDAYAQLLGNPASTVSLQLGARLDDNSAFGDFGTWRGGLSWQLAPALRVWSSAGTAFKSPTFSQLFAKSEFEIGDPDLKPEQSTNGEVGAEAATSDARYRVSVTGFSQHFRNLIQYVAAAPGDPTYTNLGGASSRGAELAATLRPASTLTVDAHWTWLHAIVTDTGVASSLSDEEGKSLLRRPWSTGGATLSYRWRGVTAAATATRVGGRDDVDYAAALPARVILPAYTTVDLAFEVPLRRADRGAPAVDLTLRGENIFAAVYQQVADFPGRGRTLIGGGRLLF